jgi:hypothetical protein
MFHITNSRQLRPDPSSGSPPWIIVCAIRLVRNLFDTAHPTYLTGLLLGSRHAFLCPREHILYVQTGPVLTFAATTNAVKRCPVRLLCVVFFQEARHCNPSATNNMLLTQRTAPLDDDLQGAGGATTA